MDRAIEALEGLTSPIPFRKAVPAEVRPAPSARKGGRLTAAGRKRLSELMKRRWAERKKKQLPSKKRGKE